MTTRNFVYSLKNFCIFALAIYGVPRLVLKIAANRESI